MFQSQRLSKNDEYARPGAQGRLYGSRDISISGPFGNRLTFANAVST